jgi:hypothetical protein
MKRQHTLLTLCLLLTISLSAQVEFAPIGAEWVYNQLVDSDEGDEALEDYFTLQSTGDTLIEGLTFRKVGPHFLHQEGEKVWFRFDNALHLIYDFGVQVGDVRTFTFLQGNYLYDPEEFKIVKIDTLYSNGISLKRFFAETTSLIYFYEFIYVERSGSLDYLLNNLLPSIQSVRLPWLRCYSDSTVNFVSPEFISFNEPNCYYQASSATEEPRVGLLSIAPNPLTGTTFTLRLPEQIDSEELTLSITDLNGRTVYQQVLGHAVGAIEVALPDLPNGLYMVQVTGEQARYLGKVVVQQ